MITKPSLAAAHRLGLLNGMIAFACRSMKCEEAARCSLVPAPPKG